MNHLSLFSGIGGADLASEWAGFTTVGQVEWADYPTKVLEKHWPDVPRWRDICEFGIEGFRARTGISTVDVISGGFPCQDVSSAAGADGKGFADEDGSTTRSGLWFQMLRVINEIRPTWVIAENVAGLLSNDAGRTFSIVIKGLEDSGYETIPIVSSACNYGASFEGKRVFIIAKTERIGNRGGTTQKCREFVGKLVTHKQEGRSVWGEVERCLIQDIRNQKTIPEDLRIDYGFSDWVDRLKCLGNAIVPAQIYPIFQAIADIEANT